MKQQLTVIQDDREKMPLIFPSTVAILDPSSTPENPKTYRIQLRVVKERIETGDYLLREYPKATIIERKKDLDELAVNCLEPRRRDNFIAELTRMRAGWHQGIVVVEGSPQAFMKATSKNKLPHFTVDALHRLMAQHGVGLQYLGNLLSIPGRRAAGEWVARLLINGAISYEQRDPI